MELKVFSRRWGHDDTYSVEKTDDGWLIQHLSIGGDCNKKGEPFLIQNLDQDSINYPSSLSDYMEYLWEQSTAEDKDNDWIQEQLNALSEWIKDVERLSPSNEFWSKYK